MNVVRDKILTQKENSFYEDKLRLDFCIHLWYEKQISCKNRGNIATPYHGQSSYSIIDILSKTWELSIQVYPGN